MTVQGTIAEILDKETVVVNRGMDDGVQQNMNFVIYRQGQRILDPETGEDMGRVEIPIARIKPVHVMEKMTLMGSDETKIETTNPIPLLNQKKTVKQDLPVEKDAADSQSVDSIEVGDLVRSV